MLRIEAATANGIRVRATNDTTPTSYASNGICRAGNEQYCKGQTHTDTHIHIAYRKRCASQQHRRQRYNTNSHCGSFGGLVIVNGASQQSIQFGCNSSARARPSVCVRVRALPFRPHLSVHKNALCANICNKKRYT